MERFSTAMKLKMSSHVLYWAPGKGQGKQQQQQQQ
jgi:hypothetical protein